MSDLGTAPKPISRAWPFKRTFYGWAVVVAAFSASFGEVPVFGPILGIFIKPMQEELGWSRATIALGFTIGSLTGSLASVVVGQLVDKYGSRLVVAIAGLLITSALVGISVVNEPWQFWAMFGLGRASAVAGVEIGTSVAVAKWFYRRRARALGLKGIGQRSGQAIMPMLIYAVMSCWDWRMAFMVLAVTTALLIVLPSLMYLRRQPEDYGLLPDGETREIGGSRGPGARDEVQWSLPEARRTWAFWLIVLFTVCTPFVQGATNLHMVINFQDQGMADGLAVSVLSIFAASSALSMMPVSLLLERIHVRYGAMLQAVVLIVSLLVLLGADTYGEAVVFAVLFGAAAGMRNIVETLLLANYFGRESLGAIKGFSAPFRIISPIGPLFAGFVRDTTGSYEVAFITFIGVSFVMLFAMVAAKPPVKRGRGPQADGVAVNLPPA
jgi:OFA family oxalate/formate antiporter-like MFS transporter